MLNIQELDGYNYDNVSDWLLKQIQKQTSATICHNTPLADQGLSSLELSNLAAKTSQKYSVEITTADIFSHPTIQDFSRLVLERKNTFPAPAKQPQSNQPDGRIAIIGMSCSFPGCGNSLESYWNLMNSGDHGLSIIPDSRWNKSIFYSPNSEKGKSYVNKGGFIDDMEAFDAELFGISPREAMVMDPQHRLLLQAAWRALEHAGMTPRSLAKSNTGVFIGIFNNDYASRVKQYRQDLDMHSATGMFGSMAAHRISYHLDLTGPSMAVDTASSASLSAIHMAVKSLAAGECDMALAGGVNVILSPEMHILCSQAGLMARDARCKTFDDSADGYIRSEGLGVVALKPLDKAIKDGDPIQAIIAGTAANQDGRSNGITAPNGEAQQRLLQQALDNAGLKQEQIQYIETHGTGTPLGDPIEVEAISKVYRHEQRQHPVILGSVKPCIGHAESAAGVAGLIKTVLCMQHEEIPAQHAFKKLNHRLEKFKSSFLLPQSNTRWPETGNQPKRAGVSSFSIGGANAHVLLEESPKAEGKIFSRKNNKEFILPIGADTPKRLRDKTITYTNYLEQQGPQFFENIAYTSGRAANSEQVGTVLSAPDYDGIIKQLREFSESGNYDSIKNKPHKTAFLFTGQGSQHPGMGLELYNSFPFFKKQIDHCADIASSELGVNLKNLLFESSQEKLNQTNYTQPALFAYEYSLARLWMEWGIEPAIMLGHSVGEYVAACLAGVFSLEDALSLVIKRGEAIQKLPASGTSAGGMYAVLTPQEQIQNILNDYNDLVDIAAVNGPENIVISGNLELLKPIISELESQNIKTVQLSVSHAFHSKLLEPALAEFHNTAQKISYSPPSIPIVSNVTGEIAIGYMLQSADYWCAHMRKGVQFLQGVKSLEGFGVDSITEVGPKPILTAMAKRIIPDFSGSWIAAKQLSDKKRTAAETAALSDLLQAGQKIKWDKVFPEGSVVSLPPTKFNKTKFLLPPTDSVDKAEQGKTSLKGLLKETQSGSSKQKENAELSGTAKLLLGWIAEEMWTKPENILMNVPLASQGMDSLMAFRMVETIASKTGCKIPLADVMQGSPAAILEKLPSETSEESEIRNEQTKSIQLKTDPENQNTPFPLTDIQHAYWVGREDMESGGVSCHLYLELDLNSFNKEKADMAVNTLIERHPMLRTIIHEDGKQQVLEKTPRYSISTENLSSMAEEQAEIELEAVRDSMSHTVHSSDTWPLFALRASRKPDQSTRLHISFDLLIGDGMTLLILARELSALYNAVPEPSQNLEDMVKQAANKFPALSLTFRDCVMHEKQTEKSDSYEAAEAYWSQKLTSIAPAPELPTVSSQEGAGRFVRRSGKLTAAHWRNLKSMASEYNLTPSGLLLAVFAEVIGAWSKSPDFTLTLTMFNRPTGHNDIPHLAGDFTSSMPHSVSLRDKTFLQRAQSIQDDLWQNLEHRIYSGVKILRKLRAAGLPSAMPVVFTSLLPITRNEPRGFFPDTLPEGLIREVPFGIFQTPQVHLDHQAWEDAGDLKWNWDFVEDRFPEGMIEAMFESYSKLLINLAESRSAWNKQIAVRLPESQRRQRIASNDTNAYLPSGLLHSPIMEMIHTNPERTAIISGDKKISYERLGEAINSIAATLAELSIKQAEPVAVLIPKHWLQTASTIGVLQAGGTYLPIDPDLPKERISAIIKQADLRSVLTLSKQKIELPEHIQRIDVDRILEAEPQKYYGTENPCSPEQLAYIIFTSGSTGTPKGVAISHAAARNTCEDINRRFRVTSEDRVMGLARLNFDLSVYDIFGVLGVGATLILPAQDELRNPEAWLQIMDQHRATLWNSVPAQLEMLITSMENRHSSSETPSLRLAMISGDWIPVTLPERAKRVLPAMELHSLGGATEASIWSIHYPVGRVEPDWKSIPYGKAMTNQTFHVLSHNGGNRPDWAVGDLYIGGKGLADGYYNDPEKTAAAFISHPITGETLYKTGDLGRWLPCGNIEFLGRDDFQVKIRGHRIELGEIEAAATSADNVIDAIAIAATRPSGGKVLALFFRTESDSEKTSEEIIEACKKMLPDYMHPDEIVEVQEWPTSPSGKIDRQKLIVPERALDPRHTAAEQQHLTAEEKVLQEIWTSILGTDTPSLESDFFALGGDSLLAIRLAAAIRKKMDKELPLGKVFELSTLRKQAKWLEEQTTQRQELPILISCPEEANASFPLSDIQQAYWIGRGNLYALGGISTHIYLEIDSWLTDAELLEYTWNELIKRHPMLRAIVDDDGRQQVLAETDWLNFPYSDLRKNSKQEKQAELEKVRAELSHQVLNPAQWPLFDIRLSRTDDKNMRIHMSFDALCVDIWSLFLVMEEWKKLYVAAKENRKATLPVLDLTFRDYIMAEREFRKSDSYAQAKKYWMNRLKSLPAGPDLSLVKRPEEIGIPHFSRLEHSLEPQIWKTIKQKASNSNITPSSLLCAAYTKTIAAWSKSPRFSINLTLFNRAPIHKDINSIVGDFTSLTLLETPDHAAKSLSDNFSEYAGLLQRRLWKDLDHRHFGGVEVMREMAKIAGDDHAVVPVVFTSAIGSEALGRDASVIDSFGVQKYCLTQTPQIWLDHQVYENKEGLVFNWDYVAELFPQGMIEDMFSSYKDLLYRLAESDDWTFIEAVRLPQPQAERRKSYNNTAEKPGTIPDQAAPQGTRFLIDGFMYHVERQPEAPALTTAEVTLNYGELYTKAVAIASEIQKRDITPASAVAVIQPKGIRQIAAVLGTLLAGCHYIPISPESPVQRTCKILDNAKCKLVITSPDTAKNIPENYDLLTDEPGIPDYFNWEQKGSPSDTAYCIYTSGSTGDPKGVVLNHQGPCNTFDDLKTRFQITPEDSVLGLANLTFDLSVFDIFGILDAGGTLVMPEPEREKDPLRWLELLKQQQITIWNTVPMLMEMLVEYCEATNKKLPSSLRLCMMSGDWIPLTLPQRIRALSDSCQIVSLGGATEASIWSILYPIEKMNKQWQNIPYGSPMYNQQFHVLSHDLSPKPEWAVGELYIGGDGLALEYLGDQDKTAAHFIRHPRSGERLYRTGDLGYFHPDGTIRFVGRNDSQIKLRGHRIELGEIESAAIRTPQVINAAATIIGEGTEKRLAVYCQSEKRQEHNLEESIVARLTEALPPYMLPDYLVLLDKLPLTANGKVDRKALPKPSAEHSMYKATPKLDSEATDKSAAFASDDTGTTRSIEKFAETIEEKLNELTGGDCSDHGASFFDLGANSLHLIRLQNSLTRELGISLDAVTIFANPSISKLAEALQSMLNQPSETEAPDQDSPKQNTSRNRRRNRRKARV
ncbi:non-ribosomal peptide synthetase/type I polyketide synthase [Maridesulfovibrio sp.]|uniref:non-ribosomal peptide synthetase/type I polyketide synthase n=1 Tax=Maridesulfovibrio sp. TaxID=2795000 RepID=UPI002A18767E|nr:non-ribosomal peptide synthetase/type I polyketide synthase [Maridesulfovibrio sp.]